MKVEDIRPEHMMREIMDIGNDDIQEVLSKKDSFEKVPCPACGSEKYRFTFERKEFEYVTCDKCETLFINPRPSFEMLRHYYETSKKLKFWNEKIFPASEDSRRNSIFKPRAEKVVELCKKYGVNTRALLDVGAGFGTFCEEVLKLNTFEKVVAVEPSQGLAKTCRDKGLQVIEKPIEEVSLDSVDVVTNFELIEHLYCPKDFLLSCKGVLPVGGLLIITTPNIKGFDLVVSGKEAGNLDGPHHINFFHPKSLGNLLKGIGFEVLEVLTPGKLDAEIVRKRALSGALDLSGRPFLKQILIEQWEEVGEAFQQFLADNNLSSHMWVVARKKA